VLPPLHEFLVDDFASIVLPSFDVNRLLHDCIRAATEGTSCAVLEFTNQAEKISAPSGSYDAECEGKTREIDERCS
jgi:hypothetical protein